ncbi:MAG: hypothetical protein HW403_462 [Dehalococcoidia bacterium]|nr:hypothetical protein [Dehalococcoidia bacterium]
MGNKNTRGLLLLMLASLAFVVSDEYGIGKPDVERIASPYTFSAVKWETQQLLDLAFQSFTGPLVWAEELRREIITLKFAREREKASAQIREDATSGARPEDDLSVKIIERQRLNDSVEQILKERASEALRAEGLDTLPFGLDLRYLFPPVEFQFVVPPSVYVISPREKISLEKLIILRPGLRDEEVTAIEAQAETLGWSALVETVGGYSTYPTIIPEEASLRSALSTIVHEWLHGYLFFRPLGTNYYRSPEMRIVNETVADIVGNEIGEKLYRDLARREPTPASGDTRAPSGESRTERFDFRKEMRETRLTVDQLLAEGKVDEAERYMEERRRFLLLNGYRIHRLNQAYFAFHGTYGSSPSSVSPIGGYLTELRRRSPSLGEFVRTVEAVSSYEDLLKIVGEK